MPIRLLKCELTKDLAPHLIDLQKKAEIILPGDHFKTKKECVVLSFDDPFFAFYHDLFPLIKKLEIRVLLGVCPRYILHSTSLSYEERLKVPKTLAFQDEFFEEKAPFCTWEELNEMVRSGFVEIASHSYSKMDLTNSFVNLEREVVLAKKRLEECLPQAICSFIYPLGKTNRQVHEFVGESHRFSFILGSRLYRNWRGSIYSRNGFP